MKHGKQVSLGPGHIVLDGEPPPLPPNGRRPPIFGPYLLWQMAEWINMPLGMQVGLDPGDFLLDEDPAPPPQKGSGAIFPIFGPCPL